MALYFVHLVDLVGVSKLVYLCITFTYDLLVMKHEIALRILNHTFQVFPIGYFLGLGKCAMLATMNKSHCCRLGMFEMSRINKTRTTLVTIKITNCT